MKYVIWGAGKYAQAAIDFLGFLRVGLFIDKEKRGEFDKKPIVGFEEYLKYYRAKTDIIVIIPENPNTREEIVDTLKAFNISNYFVFEWDDQFRIYDCLPFYIAYQKRINVSYTELLMHYDLSKCKRITIYGENQYIKYLIAEILFQNHDIDISIVDYKDIEGCHFECSNITLEDAYEKSDYIIINKRINSDDVRFDLLKRNWNKEKFIDVYEVDKFCESFKYQELKKWKNRYKDKRVFLIGNGPSLRIEDLETLWNHKDICFAFNKAYRVFDQTKWRPDVLAISDYSIVVNSQDEIEAVDCPVILADHFHRNEKCKRINGVSYIHIIDMEYKNSHPDFSEDIENGSYCGYSVSYDIGIQLAVYAGAKEIYLIGMDHTMQCDDVADERHHFIKNYFTENEKKEYIGKKGKFDNVTRAYEVAKAYADTHNVKIYNATRGGKLEVFERVNFDELF